MHKKLMLLVTLFLLLSACTPVVDTPTPAPIAVNTATPTTVLNTTTPQPAQTDLPPVLTNTPAATPVLQPEIDVTIRYVNTQYELPGLSGKLAISIMGLSNLAYLQNLKTNEQIFLGDLDWDFSIIISVSPDRELLVLLSDLSQYYIVDKNGNILQQINQISPTSGIDGWLDNNRLIVVDDWDNKDYYRLAFTTLMNIYSSEIVPLEPLYPDFGTLATNWGNNLAIYHPQLPLAVYPAAINRSQTINIYDLEKQQVRVEIPAIIWETERPRWSPDGKYLLLAGVLNNSDPDKHKEIYLFDTEGRNVFTTLFANHTPKEEFKGFSWSPNSQKIAFWIKDYSGPIYQLAILDVNSGTVTQYDLFTHGGNSGGPPIWSPDSQFVAVEQAMDFNATLVTTTLLHLDSGNAFDFSTDPDLRLDGWVK